MPRYILVSKTFKLAFDKIVNDIERRKKMSFLDDLKSALKNKQKNKRYVVGGTPEAKRLMSQNQTKHNIVPGKDEPRDTRTEGRSTNGKRDI